MKNGLLKNKLFFILLFLFNIHFQAFAEDIKVVPLINLDHIDPSYDIFEESVEEDSMIYQAYSDENNSTQKKFKFVSLSVLNKVTARVDTIKLELKENFIHGELKIYPIDCYISRPDENPETAAYINVHHNKTNKKIFTGWMLKSLPSISSIEHPIYDLWVNSCSY